MAGNGKYTCVGSVRGCCGIVHNSREAAETCIRKDGYGCGRQGGYSDRRAMDGEDYTYAERCAVGDAIMAQLESA
jgi:hypothetical protein